MTRLVRDRLTWLVYGLMAVYGYFVYGFGPSVPLLRDDQDVSRAVSGLHGTALALGAVVAGLTSAGLVARFGRGPVLRLGLAGLAAGVVVYTATAALPLTLLGALIAGSAGSVVLNTHSAVLSDRHVLGGPASISEANALAAGVGLLAPLVIGVAAGSTLGWRAGMLVTVVLAALVLAASATIAVPPARLAPTTAAPKVGLPRSYWTAWTVLVLCIAIEFAMTIWASDLLRERVGLDEGAAAGSVTALIAGMAIGRFAGARLALRHGPDWLLARTLIVTAGGFVIFWLSTTLWLSLAGLVVLGLGIALQFPLGIARAILASDGRPDLATARASLGAGLAIGLSPFLLGFLADMFGTHRAFLLVPALLLLAAIGLARGRVRFPVEAS